MSSDNKITAEEIESKIAKVDYQVVGDGRITICIITMRNGFQVIGQSACVDMANFDKELGEKIARQNAFSQLWVIEGYLARERMYLKGVTESEMDEMGKILSGMRSSAEYEEVWIVGVCSEKYGHGGPYVRALVQDDAVVWDFNPSSALCFPSREKAQLFIEQYIRPSFEGHHEAIRMYRRDPSTLKSGMTILRGGPQGPLDPV